MQGLEFRMGFRGFDFGVRQDSVLEFSFAPTPKPDALIPKPPKLKTQISTSESWVT